ncbi:proprotein convertase P-domain-containing protein [Croceibacterium aestuarii]|uniref:proprotein convertase P-domain-containing protein n=1 Tax=Croceibacterium aestuarii TaxID=3064139 RepID=UPI00272DF14D|nr:proprotein convertase P-domain-containing protein [Croceibacterium sp. D39]
MGGQSLAAFQRLLLFLAGLCLLATPAGAQSVTTYTQATAGTINRNTDCARPLVRTFSVGSSFTVGDVDIGVLITHTWRGDLQLTLQSPDGTSVQLTNGDTASTSGNNLNVLFDDSAAQLVNTDSPTGNHSSSAPPFQNTFRPRNPLSAFAGKASAGTWRLEICDLYPAADDGTFQYAELRLTSAPSSYADLSLTKSVLGSAPSSGGSVTWRLSVSNSSTSPSAASGVTVKDYLPAGFTFVSASGSGSFNASTGVWTVGAVSAGQTRTIDVTGTINATAGAMIVNEAEIASSSVVDIDSAVNNGVTGEDDYATVSFTVAGTRSAGTAPALSCPNGSTLFDWDPLSWSAGSTANTYSLGGYGSIGFTLSNPGAWLSDNSLGGTSPNLQTAMHGGYVGQKSLIQLVNLPSQSARVTTTITLPAAMQGAQFRLFDVDYAANQFADTVTVEGRYQGATVIPTLTNSIANYVIANSAYGDGGANTGTSDGNVVVTFGQPIDTIIIHYGNHTAAPIDPGQQAIAIGDITFCDPTTVLSVTKVSAVLSDPVNGTTNPKALPGAVVEYCLTISNPGAVAATNVVATDTVPATMTYTAGSMTSGASCAASSTAEDDNASGSDESDPYGASFAGSVISAAANTLSPNQSFALKFRVSVN